MRYNYIKLMEMPTIESPENHQSRSFAGSPRFKKNYSHVIVKKREDNWTIGGREIVVGQREIRDGTLLLSYTKS